MNIDPAKAAGSVRHRGRAVHFCSKGCQAKFEADPEKYLPAKGKALAMATPAEEMGRVVDPVCGMKVDPLTAKFSHEHQGTESAGSRSRWGR